MVKFLGSPLEIPDALTGVQAVRRTYVDTQDTALANRITTLESTSSSGSLGFNTKTKTSDYTAANRDFVLADASAGSFVVTLPANPGINAVISVKKTDHTINTVSIQGSGGALIDGDFGAALATPGSGATFVYDGTNWNVQSIVFFDSSVTTLNYRGDYSTSTTYYANDVVSSGGNAYVARVGNTNVAPAVDATNATWALLVLHGAKGDQGIQGVKGDTGTAATVTVGTTTTGAAGSNASVTNSGSSSAAVLNFTIPQGTKGDTGTAGPAGTVTVGTTTTGAAGTSASVTNSGTASAAVLNFTVPKGDKGDAGTPGTPGTAATVTVGTTTTGAAGSNASVTNSGTSSAAILNFTIPQGAQGIQGVKGDTGTAGTAATVAVGTTTTGAAGSNASVTNSGSTSAAVFNFTIPQGTAGTNGTNGTNATVTTGTTTTGNPGTSASVTNSGTASAAVFNFTIPRGDVGAAGAGYTFKGLWNSGSSYAINDVFTYRGTSYVTVAATSTTTAPTTSSTTPFRPFATGLYFVGTWANGTAYNPGDVVSYLGGSYVNLTATSSTTPTVGASSATWGLLALKGTDGTNATNPSFSTSASGLAAGAAPTAVVSGTYPNLTIAFGLPAGANGTNAANPVFTGAASALATGATPTATVTGTYPNLTLTLGIPAGATGSPGTNATNPSFSTAASGLTAGSSPTAVVTGTYPNLTITFGIPAGTNGTRGATWSSGTSTSPPTAGALTNDLYLNTNTQDVYQYNGTAWTVITNLKGATGLTGTRGATWTSGTSTSPSTVGALTNDLYLNTNTQDVYQYNGTAWAVITNIKGATGNNGTRGSTWTSGTSTSPPTAGALANDYYLNTNTQDVYQYNGTAWTVVTNLKGATGAPGTTPVTTIGTVTALAPGSAPTVANTGTAPNVKLDFGLPSPAPTGGVTGQFYRKNSATNYDASWSYLSTPTFATYADMVTAMNPTGGPFPVAGTTAFTADYGWLWTYCFNSQRGVYQWVPPAGAVICAAYQGTAQSLANVTDTAVKFDGTSVNHVGPAGYSTYNNATFAVTNISGGASSSITSWISATSDQTYVRAPYTGWYEVAGGAGFEASATGSRIIWPRKNAAGSPTTIIGGGSIISSNTAAAQSIAAFRTSVTFMIAGTDYIELLVRQSSGGNLNTYVNTPTYYPAMTLIYKGLYNPQ